MIHKKSIYTFLRILEASFIEYHYEGDWLVVDGLKRKRVVPLSYRGLSTLPDKIEFRNDGWVSLYDNNLSYLPENIKFNNNGFVNLIGNPLLDLPNNIEFNNKGKVKLEIDTLTSLPDTIDTFYSRLDDYTKECISDRFPDHWVVNKERFNL